jgi:hypothetical protein
LWLRHRLAFFTQAIEVKCDSFPHVFFHFFLGMTCRDSTRKLRRIGREAFGCFFDDDEIFLHGFNPACFRTLFKVPRRKIVSEFAG